MEVIIKVKNITKIFNPQEGDVIVHDGKSWYVTTKEDLLQDAYKLLADCEQELANCKAENAAFRKEVAGQLMTMSNTIQTLYRDSEGK